MGNLSAYLKSLIKSFPGIRRIADEREHLRSNLTEFRSEVGNYYLQKRKNFLQQFPEKDYSISGNRNLAHISWNLHRGGAAAIAGKLHEAGKARFNSIFCLGNPIEAVDDPSVFPISRDTLSQEMIKYGVHSSMRGFCTTGTEGLSEVFEKKDVGVVHLHNCHPDYFNLFDLPELSHRHHVLWTLHDEFPFTGHCCGTLECDGWRRDCTPCPYPKRYVELKEDRAGEHLALKKKIYRKSKLTLVCVSNWLADRVRESILRDQDVRVIYNGVDTDLFSSKDQAEAREKLGLPLEKYLCGFCADDGLQNPWKGGDFALEMAARLEPLGCTLVCIGGEKRREGKNLIELGYLADRGMMAAAYNAMDVWVHPTKAESFGLVVAEAMSCGLPVVASNVCAIPELVLDGSTGFLVKHRDADEFVRKIESLMRSPEMRQSMGAAARKRVQDRFSEVGMVASYVNLYEELLEKKSLDSPPNLR